MAGLHQKCSFAAVYVLILLPLLSATFHILLQSGSSESKNTDFRPCSTLLLSGLNVLSSFNLFSPLRSAPLDENKFSKAEYLAPRTSLTVDMSVIYKRRLSSIIASLESTSNIASWIASLDSNGKWPDAQVDYTTGCEARRASWPAQAHWRRILVMSGAWHGGADNASQWVKNSELRNATSLAMAYWFKRDFGPDIGCLDSGGTSLCPCDNPRNTLWNTNWFSNLILIPKLVAQSCMVLNASLTATEASNCAEMTVRSYKTFGTYINGVGYLTGANTLDVARISVDAALLTNNATILAEAYRYVHEELTVKNEIKADGIRADGSFGQHGGVLYNGNYGKDYSNAALDLEIAAAGTQYEAGSASRSAFELLFQGNKWMILANSLTQALHWDLSVIGRMLSFPVVDDQASGSIKMNLTTVLELGNLWSSAPLINFANQLKSTNFTNANSANLTGNRMFYTNDYMVHRGSNHVSTLKMYSRRTANTECVNSQNTKGFHLSDGTLYTYLKGNEYEDIFAAWDWDLIPGTTVDYKHTPLNCSGTEFSGVESFVGGVSAGHSGVAAMRYTNPATGSLQWQKTWFFLDSGVQHVMVNVLASKSDAPVYSVLDQKRQVGSTVVNGTSASGSRFAVTDAQTLWHSNIGYSFPNTTNNSTVLNLRRGPSTGSWSTIGTSSQPPPTVDLWAAWLEHKPATSPVEYSVWPGVGQAEFLQKAKQTPVKTLENSRSVSAIYDSQSDRIMVTFWNMQGGELVFQSSPETAALTISTTTSAVLIVALNDGTVVAADPSQSVQDTPVTFTFGQGQLPKWWTGGHSKTLRLVYPTGGYAGSSITAQL